MYQLATTLKDSAVILLVAWICLCLVWDLITALLNLRKSRRQIQVSLAIRMTVVAAEIAILMWAAVRVVSFVGGRL